MVDGIYSDITSHPSYGNTDLFHSGTQIVQFGGKRGSFLSPADLSKNMDVATNELTWMLRHATVKFWAESNSQGEIDLMYRKS